MVPAGQLRPADLVVPADLLRLGVRQDPEALQYRWYLTCRWNRWFLLFRWSLMYQTFRSFQRFRSFRSFHWSLKSRLCQKTQ